MFNPIIALIFNLVAKTWHPAVFVESPMPGPPSDDKPVRHRSKMHHTSGFPTKEAAQANVRDDLGPKIKEASGFTPRLELDAVFEWDGQGVPTIVHFFGAENKVEVRSA